jgi:hypothetical protein
MPEHVSLGRDFARALDPVLLAGRVADFVEPARARELLPPVGQEQHHGNCRPARMFVCGAGSSCAGVSVAAAVYGAVQEG